jgi:hypothetical protein
MALACKDQASVGAPSANAACKVWGDRGQLSKTVGFFGHLKFR